MREEYEARRPITCAFGRIRSRTEIHDFVAAHKRVYVVEQNRDGQMFSCLSWISKANWFRKLRSVARLDGLPIDARSVTDEHHAMEAK